MNLPDIRGRSVALRGSPERYTDHMEQLQVAYLRAVCAASGCVVGDLTIDEGVDATLRHKHSEHTHNQERIVRLEVQLKSTSNTISGGYATARMSRKRFVEFALERPSVPRIIVVMTVPSKQAHWVYSRPKGLTLHYCAYWVNLAGVREPEGDYDQVIVRAPVTQVFNDIALCGMMRRLGQGDRL